MANLNLTLSDPVLTALSQRRDLVRDFPFIYIRPIKVAKRRSCCGSRRSEQKTLLTATTRVKTALINMAPDQLKRLKARIGAKTLTLFINEGGGVKKHVL